jgi:hypothetical protein
MDLQHLLGHCWTVTSQDVPTACPAQKKCPSDSSLAYITWRYGPPREVRLWTLTTNI